ncbi:MAG: VacB/RNase II family 3'-5' exoribonuclease [Parachlamydiales bacterium]|nr:VacB/RNase II family 3'-5' exoribonuclease [Parachlamydiales bacterium]
MKDFFQDPQYKPIMLQEVQEIFPYPTPFFSSIIHRLEKEKIIQIKNHRVFSRKPSAVRGIFHLHSRGFGFVSPVHKKGPDIFIPKKGVAHAIHADEVEVMITTVSPKGPEGIIISVIKRNRPISVGIVCSILPTHYLVYLPSLGEERKIELKTKEKLSYGDRVAIKIDTTHPKTHSSLHKILGPIADAALDIDIAIEEHGLSKEFSQEAFEQARSFGNRIVKKECAHRKDFSTITTFTIDPEGAKDFDDALSISKDSKGHFHLGVHIADVAHYVTLGSPLDLEAVKRGNSTYFPNFVLPMLPHELSSELCSLKPGVLRLTVSVLMEYNLEGKLVKYDIERSFIRSKKRLTYEEAYSIVSNTKDSPFKKELSLMIELCHLLQHQRKIRGSVDLSIPETVIKIDHLGEPIAIKHISYDITHQLVEEFMLKANEIIATELIQREKQFIYRIHEQPSLEDLKDFFTQARNLGFSLPSHPTIKEIQHLFHEAKETPHAQKLSLAYIKSMKLAFYSPDNIGHYGLALEHYTHFTSPIRRYSDLMIERLLFDEPPSIHPMKTIARICSEKERNSMLAESSLCHLKKIRYLLYLHQKNPHDHYVATITKIKAPYMDFDIDEFHITGSVTLSSSHDKRGSMTKRKNPKKLKRTSFLIGDKISVKIASVDLIYQKCHYQLVEK